MEGRSGVSKVVIFIGDGSPVGAAMATDYNDSDLEVDHNADGTHSISIINNVPSEYDYDNFQDGTEFITLTKECPVCHEMVTDTVICECLDEERAYYEADLIKNQGIKIYTVGYQLPSYCEEVLRSIQNAGYVNAVETSDLKCILDDLASDILMNAGTKAVVSETLGNNMEYVEDSVVASIYDSEAKAFNWNIGTIKEEDTITLEYTVKLSEEAQKVNGIYEVNPISKLTYIDYKGVEKSIEFPRYTIEVKDNEEIEPEIKPEVKPEEKKAADKNPKTGDNTTFDGELFILAGTLLLISSISLVVVRKKETNNIRADKSYSKLKEEVLSQ